VARFRKRPVELEVWLTPPPAGGFKDVNEVLMKEMAA
jgi:hypothetical protein